jgi:hypothetical protein
MLYAQVSVIGAGRISGSSYIVIVHVLAGFEHYVVIAAVVLDTGLVQAERSFFHIAAAQSVGAVTFGVTQSCAPVSFFVFAVAAFIVTGLEEMAFKLASPCSSLPS